MSRTVICQGVGVFGDAEEVTEQALWNSTDQTVVRALMRKLGSRYSPPVTVAV